MKKYILKYVLIGSLICLSQACRNQSDSTEAAKNMHPSYSYSAQTITLPSGQQIAYREAGEGEQSLVMIHGLGSYLPVWNKLFPLLTPQFHCIAIDLPAYGQSGEAVDTVSMDFFAAQIEAFIQAKGLENVSLIGHSMGGQIAMRLALRAKLPLQKLILLAPAGIEIFSQAEGDLMKQIVTPASILALPDSQIEQNFAINFFGNRLPADAAFMYEDRLRMKADSAAYDRFSRLFPQSVRAMLDGPVFQELGELDLPVLVVFGEEDALIPNRYLHPDLTTQQIGEKATEALPQGRLMMIPECGHFVPWDGAEALGAAMTSFLNDLK